MGVQKPNTLKELAKLKGETPEALVRRTVRESGSVSGAAVELGVARNTISYWLKKAGLRAETRRVVTLTKKAV